MASPKYNIIRNAYRLRKITAADVWSYVDGGELTASEATKICGPRPKEL